MIKRQTLRQIAFSALTLSLMVGGTLYYVKYHVGKMRDHLTYVNQEIIRVTETTHVLQAEWGHLNHPDRLTKLNQDHGNLMPVNVIQMASVDAFMEDRKAFTTTMLASLDT